MPIEEIDTTIVMPDICDQIERAYLGTLDNHTAEIPAYRLIPRHRARLIGADEMTDEEGHEAARTLTKLCQAFLHIHADAVFSVEKSRGLWEDLDVNDWKEGRPPIRAFYDRIRLQVRPAVVPQPKVCFLLTMKRSDGVRTPYRLIVDPEERPTVYVQVCQSGRLGEPTWTDVTADHDRRLLNELHARALLALAGIGATRRESAGVVYVDLGDQRWYEGD